MKIFNSKIIENAIRLVDYWHRGQLRKGGIFDFWIHPIAVGMILAKAGVSDEVIAAGICHDLLEDTDCPESEIAQACSDEVLKMVKLVTVDKNISDWKAQSNASIELIKNSSDQVKLVFAADKIHNLQSLIELLPDYGLSFFEHLGKTPEDKLWLEDQRCLMLRQSLKHPLVDEYDRLVDEFVDLLEDLVEKEESSENNKSKILSPNPLSVSQFNYQPLTKKTLIINNNQAKNTEELLKLKAMQAKINALEQDLRIKLEKIKISKSTQSSNLKTKNSVIKKNKPRSKSRKKFAYLKKDEVKLLLPAILALIIDTGEVDSLLLQKHLNINFAVSFRVLKELKRLHIIKRVDAPKPRKVNILVAKQCLNELT